MPRRGNNQYSSNKGSIPRSLMNAASKCQRAGSVIDLKRMLVQHLPTAFPPGSQQCRNLTVTEKMHMDLLTLHNETQFQAAQALIWSINDQSVNWTYFQCNYTRSRLGYTHLFIGEYKMWIFLYVNPERWYWN